MSATKARRLRDAVRHLVVAHGALEDTRRPCGTELSIPHAYALLELQSGQPMTVSELATKLAIDRTNVSRLCARMETGGELSREPHPEDARARVLRLTAIGQQLAQSVDAQSSKHFARLAAELGDDAVSIISALQQLSQAMACTEDDE